MFKKLLANTRQVGNKYESLAEQYLVQQGLQSHSKNYYCRYGELDLIMKEGSTWVFVEVKYRKNQHFGGAINALSTSKIAKLQRSIYQFLTSEQLHNVAVRVDFVAIEGTHPPTIKWIKNIF